MNDGMTLIDGFGKTWKVNVRDVKIMFLVDELIRCLPDDKAFGLASRYHAHLKHVEICFKIYIFKITALSATSKCVQVALTNSLLDIA